MRTWLAEAVPAAMRRFRRRRMAALVQALALTPETTVLDVGGTPLNWTLAPVLPRLTLLNGPAAGTAPDPRWAWVVGDGCQLPFRDAAFDIVVSNSVIEHVGDAARQAAFAREVRRVGRAYWVQTPNRGFPVEAHLLTPLLHWLPRPWQRWLVPRWTVWAWLTRPTPDRRDWYGRHYLDDIRLLSGADLVQLFPEARLRRERVLGWTKSLVAERQNGRL